MFQVCGAQKLKAAFPNLCGGLAAYTSVSNSSWVNRLAGVGVVF